MLARQRGSEQVFRILIDTCVWFDLAKDYQQRAILAALKELVRHQEIALILPCTVVDEFSRNKARVIEESGRSLSDALKRAKDAVEYRTSPANLVAARSRAGIGLRKDRSRQQACGR